MNAITNPDLSLSNDRASSQDGVTGYKSSQRLYIEAMKKETQDITLTTKEGDIVTISALSMAQSNYMEFNYTESVKGKTSSYNTNDSSASASNTFNMTVKGDLNDEEKDDIQKIIGELDKIMKSLASGDMESIKKNALGIIDDTETISGLNATLKYETHVSMERRVTTQMTGSWNENNKPSINLSDTVGLFSELITKITDQLKEIIDNSQLNAFGDLLS